MKDITRFPRSPKDLAAFHSWKEFEQAPPITFAIEGLLQNDVATLIAGLSDHGKTFILLSMVRALFSKPGTKLWGRFKVNEQASRVFYLIPESGITPFKDRLKRFGLYPYVEAGRLLVRTLSKGPTLPLDDEGIVNIVRGGHVVLDTLVRFSQGDENSAGDNRTLDNHIRALLSAGAQTVVAAHHSPKSFANQNVMTLENMVRGSSDIGAMVATAWGVRQLDRDRNVAHIENIKAHDFQPCGPFQIIGRPYINEEGDFRMHKKPGDCGTLAQELVLNRHKAGKRSHHMNKGIERVVELIEKHGEAITDKEIVRQFKKHNWGKLGESTARKYRKLALGRQASVIATLGKRCAGSSPNAKDRYRVRHLGTSASKEHSF
jgi:hypothetical protein